MSELTGKDKAIAQTLIANGFEFVELGDEDEEYALYFAEVSRPCYEIENWLVSISIFDSYIQAEELNSSIRLIRAYQGHETDDGELLAVKNLIHAAQRQGGCAA